MSKKRTIIFLSGKQHSGKDTVADILCEVIPDLKREALALAIKSEFGKAKNITVKEIDLNKTMYREDLIELGQKRRQEDPDYWINKITLDNSNVIITDVRLKLEYETFKKMGAISIRIQSDREERLKRGRLVREDDVTEVDLDEINDWDYIIENNSDLENLKVKAEELAKEIQKNI